MLTIFTATYNRGYCIDKLYRSLQRQKNFNFEWLVVDDGSTDNTKELFDIWTKERNNFQIRYYYQENTGLIGALNKGVTLANGEYFSKIDSDDYVTDNFTEKIEKWIQTISEEDDDVYAVGGVRITKSGLPIKGSWPTIPKDKFIDATDLERNKYNLDADMTEAWKTQVLRKYKFPVWPGEKFAPEQLVFYAIALEGLKIRWHPDALTICEYRDDGLTKGASKLEKENPMGYAMMYNQYLLIHKNFKQRFNDASQATALCLYAGHLSYLKESNSKLLSLLSFPVGILLGFRRKKQFSKI